MAVPFGIMFDMPAVIEINKLTVTYGKTKALDDISLKVERGEIFGFLGPNGAGKTTAIKAILGIVPVPRDTITIHGVPPSRRAARKKLGYLPEDAAYHRFLTPKEILMFYGEIFGIPTRELKKRVRGLLEFVGLAEYQNKRVSELSKGTVQKIGLAQALVNQPDVLVLDEPTSGLDPIARRELRNALNSLRKEGRTIFFSSHELSEVETLSDKITIMRKGRVVRQGALHEIMKANDGKSLEQHFVEAVTEATR